MSSDPLMTRRSALALGGAFAAAALAAPGPAQAREAAWIGPATAEALKARGWEGPVFDARLKLVLPEVVENGANAAIDLTAEPPEGVHVKRLGLYAELNFTPEIAVYGFGPATGAPVRISVRTRLAESQRLLAVAELSNGAIWAADFDAKVAIGGCAG